MKEPEHGKKESLLQSLTMGRLAFLVLTFVLVGTALYMVRFLLHAIVFGALLSFVLWPVHHRILQFLHRVGERFRKHKTDIEKPICASWERYVASAISVVLFGGTLILILFLIISPLLKNRGLFAEKEREIVDKLPVGIEAIDNWLSGKKGVFSLAKSAERRLIDVLDKEGRQSSTASSEGNSVEKKDAKEGKASGENIRLKAERGIKYRISWLKTYFYQHWKNILSSVWRTVFHFFIMLFVMYHFFLDGGSIVDYVLSISPLDEEAQRHVVNRIKDVTRAVFYGILGTACVQAVFAMIIFAIFGMHWFVLGVLVGLCSFIPFVGTGLVWVPASLYLCSTGHYVQGIVLFVYCAIVVANVDSLVRPLLIKKGGKTGMSYLVLFFSLLGGLQTFGLIGLVYGPLLAGVCSVCLLLFSTYFKQTATVKNEPVTGSCEVEGKGGPAGED